MLPRLRVTARECATPFQNGHSKACEDMQNLQPLVPNLALFEDTERVPIAEMVVTKTPNIHSRGVPHPNRDQLCADP